MEGVAPEVAMEAMRLAANKLPLKTRFVQRPAVIKNAAPEVEAGTGAAQ
jgi:large subunit ribosomal protein L16